LEVLTRELDVSRFPPTDYRTMRTPAILGIDRMGGALLRGLVAGAAGTAAMTVSSTLEMRLRRRPPSDAPAAAAGEVLGVVPRDEAGKRRFGTLVHWAYGTSWGAARGVIGAAGVQGLPAALLHLGLVWGAEQVVLPTLGVAEPGWRWGAAELSTDLLHHGVYAGVTSLVYELLERAA
jgi:hypothetical protein